MLNGSMCYLASLPSIRRLVGSRRPHRKWAIDCGASGRPRSCVMCLLQMLKFDVKSTAYASPTKRIMGFPLWCVWSA